jgi:hypothetical protein
MHIGNVICPPFVKSIMTGGLSDTVTKPDLFFHHPSPIPLRAQTAIV